MEYPFGILGFKPGKLPTHGSTFYFLIPGREYATPIKQAILAVKATAFPSLVNLAPLGWWESMYGHRDGVSWDMAISDLMSACYRRGIYVPSAPTDSMGK